MRLDQLVLLNGDRAELGGPVVGLRGQGGLRARRNAVGSRLTHSGLSDLLTVWAGTGLTRLPVLNLRSRGTGLTVLPVRAGLTVGTADRWLTHEHFPQGFFEDTGTWQDLARLPTRC